MGCKMMCKSKKQLTVNDEATSELEWYVQKLNGNITFCSVFKCEEYNKNIDEPQNKWILQFK